MIMDMAMSSSTAGAGAIRRVLIAAPTGMNFSPVMVAVAAAALISGASSPTCAASISPASAGTTSAFAGAIAREEDVQPDLAASMSEIKRRTGATWDHLANFFKVSRRTVHTWANGGAISADNIEKVQHLIQQIYLLKDLRPFQIRKALLGEAQPARNLPESSEPAILVSDPTPFRHNLAVTRTGRTKIKTT